MLWLYGAAGAIGGAVPVHGDWRPPADGVRIHVEDNGIHTGIVVPVAAAGVDWRDMLRAEDLRDSRYAAHGYVSFGWGDRAFYVGTPTWADVRPSVVLAAALGSDATVMHVSHLPDPEGEPGVRSFTIRPDEYRRLAAFIRASFRTNANGRAASIPGYGAHDAFYEARGRYSAIRTCNAWTGEALAHAGVRTGRWTPFPFTVTQWFEIGNQRISR